MAKQKYTVEIKELLLHYVEIEAETPEQALQQARKEYFDSEIVLDADDFVDVEFEISDNL